MPKPHEIQFHYDEKILSSCALSLLRHHHTEPSPRVIVNTNFDDTVILSPLDDEEEEEVISDRPSGDDDEGSDILLQSSREMKHGHNNDCRVLFEQHAAHYHRPPLTKEEVQYWEEGANNWEGKGGVGTTTTTTTTITPRIRAFLQSVSFVQTHNSKYHDEQSGQSSGVYHRVALNRFSDKMPHELPLMASTTTAADDENFSPRVVVSLHDEEDIYNIGKELGRWSDIEQQRTTATSTSTSTTTKSNIFDSWWWLGDDHYHYFSVLFGRGGRNSRQQQDEPLARSKNKEKHHHHHYHHDDSIKSNTNKLLLSNENELDGLVDEDGATHHDKTWDKYLNWSTKDNPDGVRIVHDPIDQGYCGSCWAVSATGTIEGKLRF